MRSLFTLALLGIAISSASAMQDTLDSEVRELRGKKGKQAKAERDADGDDDGKVKRKRKKARGDRKGKFLEFAAE